MARAIAALDVDLRSTELLPCADLPAFQRRLIDWFAAARRDLDWRRSRDPYRIWISEIMLQQTRVATVVPYYRRFLTRFPAIEALARAHENAVLQQWAGLGYYSRARNLHRAAKEIVARHGGEFPKDMAAALSLPGIGSYTAAAVLSIAYGEPHAVVDGNVARVLARVGAVRGDLRQSKRWRYLCAAANALLPANGASENSAGDWNQAMMELGATVCMPRAPRCDACPISRWCRAHALGISVRLPERRRKRKPVRLALSAAIVLDPRSRTFLVQQKSDHGKLFSNLWHFPAIQAPRPAPQKLARYLKSAFAVEAHFETLRLARHTVTFRRIVLAPFLARVTRLPDLPPGGARIVPLAEVGRLPVSSATKKIAAAASDAIARKP